MKRPKWTLVASTLFGLGLIAALLGSMRTAPPSSALGNVHYVAMGPDCGGATPCYSGDIQAAINAAQAGDHILIAAGVYTQINTFSSEDNSAGVISQVVYITKSLTLEGGYTTDNWSQADPAAHPTTLNAQGQGRTVVIIGAITVTLRGLEIAGGDAANQGGGASSGDVGGGIYVRDAAVNLTGNTILNNTATHFGGGVYLTNSPNATLEQNAILNNTTTHFGGGVYLTNSPGATLKGNTLVSNTATLSGTGAGAGIHLYHSDNVSFIVNTLRGNHSAGDGGGIYVYQSNNTLFSNNTLLANSAGGSGGGIYVLSSEHAALQSSGIYGGNLVDRNTAGRHGGGLCLIDSAWAAIADNLVISNSAGMDGGGVFVDQSGILFLDGNTIRGNAAQAQGGGLYMHNSPNAALRNSVLDSNNAQDGGGLGLEQTYTVKMENLVIAANTASGNGSGLWVKGAVAEIKHATIVSNTQSTGLYIAGDGAQTYGALAMTNTIVSGHQTGVYVAEHCTATLNSVLWHNTSITVSHASAAVVNAQRQYNGEPRFSNPAAANYRLDVGSAAIDKGIDANVFVDLAGRPRPAGPAPDLGAFEREQWYIYLPLVAAP